jgi:spore maturation protein CgeB
MKTHRVLISYFFGPDTIPLGEACAEALSALGCTVERFDCRVEHPRQWLYKRCNRLARPVLGRDFDLAKRLGHDPDTQRAAALDQVVSAFRPDLLLVLRGHAFDAAQLARLKTSFGLKTCAWWLYGHEAHADLLPDIPAYDHYFSIYETHIPGVVTLPALAVDTRRYHARGPRTPYLHDIAFVGRHSPRRDCFIAPLADLPLSIWGAGWRKPKQGWRPQLWRRVIGSGVWGEALVEVYRRSKITLNVSVWSPAEEPGLNLRVFDVPACGGFLLTDHSPELAEYFRPGIEIETWQDADELRDKLRFYLEHDAARERIAAAGHARVQQLPTYTDRMRTLLQHIDGNPA